MLSSEDWELGLRMGNAFIILHLRFFICHLGAKSRTDNRGLRRLHRAVEIIGQTEMWSFLNDRPVCEITRNTTVRNDAGHFVKSFLDLATKVAELQFRNREQVLLFRGQTGDHKNRKKHTTLKPSLFRPKVAGHNPSGSILTSRFQKLQQAEQQLQLLYKGKDFLGVERLKRQ